MRPEQKSQLLLGVTRSKAKMIEYGVPEEYHINIIQDPARLFTISIGLLGDLAAQINRGELDPGAISELQSNLLFSARFFDAYLQSKLNESLDPYLVLLGAASYYLCNLPGSASVLANSIGRDCPNLDGYGLERLLLWLLQADLKTNLFVSEGPFGEYIDNISNFVLLYFKDGTGVVNLLELATRLRTLVYEYGTPRQLLFGDVITAVLIKKLYNSTWKALPLYSGLSSDKWMHALQKQSFIKELWPAQHLMGKNNVLKGTSAIVQMPTSAGKTKAIELIIRSAFIADRTSLTIIIAPFRALCREIKNSLIDAFYNEPIKIDELSDALQPDFEIEELLGHQQILVVTPEKLLYVLRHVPVLASHAGLLVFDEGHQFDSGTRGIIYELLLTSLRSMLSEGTQKVLISAVISNAEAVGNWLNGNPNVVEGTNLNPTFRSVGFVSWIDQLGRIEYVDSQNAEQGDFFVPRVIERFKLKKKMGERHDRYFPEKSDGHAIALYLGLKLVPNGSIAIFCGKKSTAVSICEKVADIIDRGLPLDLPLKLSDQDEVIRLHRLHIDNLGTSASVSISAKYGIFSHHGNTPHGIRLAVEYSMRENLIHFVVCTSTLAQGVNLPIRYLIVTSVYQGMERIKVRDFHNLIGRAGRAGMHTEGSILFADPIIYDKRKAPKEKWRWKQVKELLEPKNSEPCISNLLSIFEPIKSDDEKYNINIDSLDFVKSYVAGSDEIPKMMNRIIELHGDKGFSKSGLERQIVWKISLICAVESFLLSHWDETETGLSDSAVINLAEGTLAFYLADDQKKESIHELFKILAGNINTNITEPTRRIIYGRTLYGIHDAKIIEEWVHSNISRLLTFVNEDDLLDQFWPLFSEQLKNGAFKKFDKPAVLQEIAHGWINGKSFNDLFDIFHQREVKILWGSQRREIKIDHVVDVCEGVFAFDGALMVSALCEFIEAVDQEGTIDLIFRLHQLQKRLKYGLPSATTIALHELGFSDRVISQKIADTLHITQTDKSDIINTIRRNKIQSMNILLQYPSYYQMIINRYLRD